MVATRFDYDGGVGREAKRQMRVDGKVGKVYVVAIGVDGSGRMGDEVRRVF